MKKTIRTILKSALILLWSITLFVIGMQFAEKEEKQVFLSVPAISETDPIEEFRTERQQLRQQQIAQLNDMIHSEQANYEIIAMAQTRLLDLMEWAEQETTMEGILRMRDFDDVVATVHDGSVNIMIRAESLNQQQTAVILDLVRSETEISGENVKIIPIN